MSLIILRFLKILVFLLSNLIVMMFKLVIMVIGVIFFIMEVLVEILIVFEFFNKIFYVEYYFKVEYNIINFCKGGRSGKK